MSDPIFSLLKCTMRLSGPRTRKLAISSRSIADQTDTNANVFASDSNNKRNKLRRQGSGD